MNVRATLQHGRTPRRCRTCARARVGGGKNGILQHNLTMCPPWLARSSGVQPCFDTLASIGTPLSTSRCTCAASPVCEAQCRSRMASTSTGMTGAAGLTAAGGSFGVAGMDRRCGTVMASPPPRVSRAEGGPPRGPAEPDLELRRVSAALVGWVRCGSEASVLRLLLRRRSRLRKDCFIARVSGSVG